MDRIAMGDIEKSNRGVPPASSEAARNRMRATRQRNTKAEMLIRRILHVRGLRYRVDHPVLERPHRRADIVFPRAKLAVFVDGCFWHGCPTHGTWPKSNAGFWRKKLETNQARDRDTNRRLEALGWQVLRFWEHEDPEAVAETIDRALRSRLGGSSAAKGTSTIGPSISSLLGDDSKRHTDEPRP